MLGSKIIELGCYRLTSAPSEPVGERRINLTQTRSRQRQKETGWLKMSKKHGSLGGLFERQRQCSCETAL